MRLAIAVQHQRDSTECIPLSHFKDRPRLRLREGAGKLCGEVGLSVVGAEGTIVAVLGVFSEPTEIQRGVTGRQMLADREVAKRVGPTRIKGAPLEEKQVRIKMLKRGMIGKDKKKRC